MSNLYRLVNPHIEGDMKKSVKSKNSVAAARTLYKNLSEHFSNSVPKFYFTIQKGASGKGKYYHFLVKEKKGSDDEIKFNIESYNPDNESTLIKNFESKLSNFKNKFNQAGGKARKGGKKSKKYDDDFDDDEDLDSSEEIYVAARNYRPLVTSPFYYWWYDSKLYNITSVFVPPVYPYLTPIFEIK